MSDKTAKSEITVSITKDTRNKDNWVLGNAAGGVTFCAKVFDEGSVYGINKGRVSKLDIRLGGKIIVNYDRGWDVKPTTPEHKAIYQAVLRKMKGLGKASELSKPSILGELEESKGEVNGNRSYVVTVAETMTRTMTIEAASREEAEKIVADKWDKSEIDEDEGSFRVAISAEPANRAQTKEGERS